MRLQLFETFKREKGKKTPERGGGGYDSNRDSKFIGK